MRTSITKILFIFPLILATLSCTGAVSVTRANGPLAQELYVWQRAWTDDVQRSIQESIVQPEGFIVLGSEVSFDGGQLRSSRIPVEYDLLRQTKVPIGLALRIGTYSGRFSREGEPIATLASLAVELVANSKAAGLQVKELQLDFDCPESKLDGYRRWVDVIRRKIAPVPLTITVLPVWLNHREFKRLAQAADGFVLQVHSIEPPTGINDSFTLCDPAKARDWIEQAAKLGLSFRVALPTYGYLVAFDKDGRFVGLSAEGPARSWSSDMRLRQVRADPVEMAGLVESLTEDRPSNLDGIIWYRMPVATDRLNWPWPTLAAVIQGRAPQSSLRVEAVRSEPGLFDIRLINDGETDELPDVLISVSWSDAALLAYDVLRDFSAEELEPTEIRLHGPDNPLEDPIRPGETWAVGWLRFNIDTEVDIHVSPIPH